MMMVPSNVNEEEEKREELMTTSMEQRVMMSEHMTNQLTDRVSRMFQSVEQLRTAAEEDINPLVNVGKAGSTRKIQFFSSQRQVEKPVLDEDTNYLPQDLHNNTSTSTHRKGRHGSTRKIPVAPDKPVTKRRNSMIKLGHDIALNHLAKKELNALADKNITRSIQLIHFTYNDHREFDTHSSTMFLYVMSQIRIPESENVHQILNNVLKTPTLVSLYDTLFWFIVYTRFMLPKMKYHVMKQNGSNLHVSVHNPEHDSDIKKFISDLSNLYVKLSVVFTKIPASKQDRVHFYLPFILGRAVLVCMTYMCPGSRHLYTDELQHYLFSLCCEVVHGSKLSDTSIALNSHKLFEGSPSLIDNDEHPGMPKRGVPGGEEEVLALKSETYDSRQVGSLFSNYLENSTKSGKVPGAKMGAPLRRSVEKNVQINKQLLADSNNYIAESQNILASYQQEKAKYLSAIRKSRSKARETLHEIHAQEQEVLTNGTMGIETHIRETQNHNHHHQHTKKKSLDRALRSSHTRSKDGTVHQLSIADQIIATNRDLEAERKSERQKQRTKARIMLCGA